MHQDPHAFCLLEYRTDAGETEIIWNSRDGVTPFMITSPSGAASHCFGVVRYAPLHLPRVGDRIFVDMTEQRGRALAAIAVEAIMAREQRKPPAPGQSVQDLFESRETLQQAVFDGIYTAATHAPDLLMVTAGYLQELELSRCDPGITTPIAINADAHTAAAVPPAAAAPVTFALCYDRQGRPIPFDECGRLLQSDAYSLIANTRVGSLRVSTVWIGLNRAWKGPPLIFETRIFVGRSIKEAPAPFRSACNSYRTEAEATEGHAAAVAYVATELRKRRWQHS